MKNVKWTDNVCTVGGTCVHGYFTGDDLKELLTLCPSGDFVPTFYHERLPAGGYKDVEQLKSLNWYGKSVHDAELGYYFMFMENEGQTVLSFLKEKFPMVRGEGCF